MGNQDTAMSPHGCYPCQGDDRWITIAVATDGQWQAVCRVLGQDGWAADTRFKDSLSRWKNRGELDALIGPVTSSWDAHDLMHALQKEGVAAGAVFDSKDLLFDPHLGERGFYEVVTHHDRGSVITEQYRAIRTQILARGRNRQLQTTVITSGDRIRQCVCGIYITGTDRA